MEYTKLNPEEEEISSPKGLNDSTPSMTTAKFFKSTTRLLSFAEMAESLLGSQKP
jgi:hypothetical protein